MSVCGTGTLIQYLPAFLVSVILGASLLYFHYPLRYQFFLFLAHLPLLRPLHLLSIIWCRNFNLLSIRYAFRAGQNLPDKEFRYLRTVIVTAAVHWGFGSKLRLAANPSP